MIDRRRGQRWIRYATYYPERRGTSTAAGPCPLGDNCPDAKKYGDIHPAPPAPTLTAWTERLTTIDEMGCPSVPADFARSLERLVHQQQEALDTIAGGWTSRFPDAPDVMALSPDDFRHAMWTWSQAVANHALAAYAALEKEIEQ